MIRNYYEFYKSQAFYGCYYRIGQLEYEVINEVTCRTVYKNKDINLCYRYIYNQCKN